MHKFLIIIEKAKNNYSAFSPDLPGCIATGKTVKQAEKNMYEAIELHLQGLAEDNIPVPESTAIAEYMVMNG
jgi:predicted RNase H-like HicB family nuclease